MPRPLILVTASQGYPGPPGAPGPPGQDGQDGTSGDYSYVHTQSGIDDTWTINHGLNKMPSVTVVDSGDNVVIGEVRYVDANTVQVAFSAEFSGKAYLN